jgi:hypothetical protein
MWEVAAIAAVNHLYGFVDVHAAAKGVYLYPEAGITAHGSYIDSSWCPALPEHNCKNCGAPPEPHACSYCGTKR